MDPAQVFRDSRAHSHETILATCKSCTRSKGSEGGYSNLNHVRRILDEEEWTAIIVPAPAHPVNLPRAHLQIIHIFAKVGVLEPLVALSIGYYRNLHLMHFRVWPNAYIIGRPVHAPAWNPGRTCVGVRR